MSFSPKKFRVKKVSRVALVDAGANLTPGIQKSKDGSAALAPMIRPWVKSSGSEGLLYSLVFAPYIVDAHGHYMAPEDVKAACHTFGESGMQMDIMHGEEVLEKSRAAVVESMILQGKDERFPTEDHLGREIPHKGAWAMVVKRNDPNLMHLTEFSLTCLGGDYELEDAPAEELAILKHHNPDTTEEVEDDMPKDGTPDITEALKTFGADLTKSIADSLKEALAPVIEKQKPEEKPEEKPLSPLELLEKARAEKRGSAHADEIEILLDEFELERLEDAADLPSEEYAEFKSKLRDITSPARKRRGSTRKVEAPAATKSFGFLSTGDAAKDKEIDDYFKSFEKKN